MERAGESPLFSFAPTPLYGFDNLRAPLPNDVDE
jgi:hypothetical protein